MAVTTTT